MKRSSNPFHTIKIQLLIIFLALGIVPSLILGGFAGNVMYKNEFDKSIDYSQTRTELIASNIDIFTDRCLQYAEMVANNNDIQEVLREPLESTLKERYKKELDTSYLLYFYNQSIMNEVFGIYVIGANGIQSSSNSMPFRSSTLNKDDLYLSVLSSPKPVWFANHGDSSITTIEDKHFYCLGIPIIDKATGAPIGIVIVEFDDTYFSRMINTNDNSNDNIFHIRDYTGFNYSNNNFSENISSYDVSISNDDGITYFTDYDSDYIFTETKLNTGFDLISLINLKQIKQSSLSLTKFIIFFTILLTMISTVLFININSKVIGPVEEIKKGIELVQDGNYNVQLSSNASNEFGTLVNGFNKMINTINIQMDNIYTSQRKLRKANLDVLQAQINPHFLYNTLDSIIWLSRAKDYASIMTLTDALINFLRIGLSRGFKTITVEDELNHVESYLKIQKIRYSNALKYNIDHPKEARQYFIPKLILQPLVENSIIHGMDSSHNIGTIDVKCEFTDKNINIFIHDTGAGIDTKTLEKINSMDYKPSSGGVGIKNVNERLKLYYKNYYTLKITSTIDDGTTVHIQIPKETEVRDD